MRTCVGCRRKRPVSELVRVARDPSGSLAVDRRLPGRGAWLCRGSATCVDRAVSRRAFDRAFRVRLDVGQVDRDRLVAAVSTPAQGDRGSEAQAR